jgi:hypothetical protein
LPKFKSIVVSFACPAVNPIPLPSKAAQREADFRQRDQQANEDYFVVPMFTLRCNACDRETLYVPWDVRDFEGSPKVQRARKASARS